ncbi:hypothetical protein HGRIS_005410 [Hohenbuehelia grisea]|uniref:Uncharacterized protein n=1 Tax=Hohenbuehelia grisea TaxID=104357 RepID=A0ABR3JF36_9AGAR
MLNSGGPLTKQQADFMVRLALAIKLASQGTREAPWYGAYCEVLQFFLALVITTVDGRHVTVIFPQFPIPSNVDLCKDDDEIADDVALPPSPTLGKGKNKNPAQPLCILGSRDPKISHRIPDFARKRFFLPLCGEDASAERLDLLVENKSLATDDDLRGQLNNARVQSDQQAMHAFDQDSKINVVGVITSAGRYFRYHETYRSELDYNIRSHQGDNDEFRPKKLPLFPRDGAPSPESRPNTNPLFHTPVKSPQPSKPEHSQPSGSSGPPRKRQNVEMEIFGGHEPEARYTDEKSPPDTDPIDTSPLPHGFRPEVHAHMHAFEYQLQSDYAVEVGKHHKVFDIGCGFEKLQEIFGRIRDRLLMFDEKWETKVIQASEAAED